MTEFLFVDEDGDRLEIEPTDDAAGLYLCVNDGPNITPVVLDSDGVRKLRAYLDAWLQAQDAGQPQCPWDIQFGTTPCPKHGGMMADCPTVKEYK